MKTKTFYIGTDDEQADDATKKENNMAVFDYPPEKVKQPSSRKKRMQAERKKQPSLNGFLLLPDKTSIYSVS